jgi:hypothetical protein
MHFYLKRINHRQGLEGGCLQILEDSNNSRVSTYSTVATLFLLQNLTPATVYTYWAEHRNYLFTPNSSDVSPYTDRKIGAFQTLPFHPVSTATLLPAELLTNDGFTLRWQPPQGATPPNAAPEAYLLDLATDSLFAQPVRGFAARRVEGTSLRVGGLLPNTTYFCRLRAVEQGRSGAYSPTTKEQTLSLRRYNADRISIQTLARSLSYIDFSRRAAEICSGNFYYYTHATNASATWGAIDTLLAQMVDNGFCRGGMGAGQQQRSFGTGGEVARRRRVYPLVAV